MYIEIQNIMFQSIIDSLLRDHQCFPYIDQCVAQHHRMNTERHKLILLLFDFFCDFEI